MSEIKTPFDKTVCPTPAAGGSWGGGKISIPDGLPATQSNDIGPQRDFVDVPGEQESLLADVTTYKHTINPGK